MASDVQFYKQRHVKFFTRCLDVLPNAYQTLDTNRMTVLFFAIFGLDILGELEAVIDAQRRRQIISWVYSLQVLHPTNATKLENGSNEEQKQQRTRGGQGELEGIVNDNEKLSNGVKNGVRTEQTLSSQQQQQQHESPSNSSSSQCPLKLAPTDGDDRDDSRLFPAKVDADLTSMLGFRSCPGNGARLSSATQSSSISSPNVNGDESFGRGSIVDNAFDSSHVTMTYNALAILLILKDDLAGVDRQSILKGLKSLQNADGSFSPMADGGERDMRFLFCAAAICSILTDDCSLGMDVDKATTFVTNSFTYEGAFGMSADAEAHGGSSFCAIASLVLMNKLESSLTSKDIRELIRWLSFRQATGFQGRANKPVDCCYSFWVGASLKLLHAFQLAQFHSNVQFTLSCQNPITGGFAKWPDVHPDALHACLGLAGLSLLENDPREGETDSTSQKKLPTLGLKPIHAPLNITTSAFQHLLHLKKKWNASS